MLKNHFQLSKMSLNDKWKDFRRGLNLKLSIYGYVG